MSREDSTAVKSSTPRFCTIRSGQNLCWPTVALWLVSDPPVFEGFSSVNGTYHAIEGREDMRDRVRDSFI